MTNQMAKTTLQKRRTKMKKINITTIITSLFAFSFLAITAIYSPQVNAATDPSIEGVNLTSTESCTSSLAAKSREQIQVFNKARYEKRDRSLKSIESTVNKFYESRDKTFNEKIKSVERMHNRYAQSSDIQISTKLPESKKTQIINDIKARKTILDQKFYESNGADTVQQAAIATCSMVFDTKIYSELVPKAKAQMQLDKIAMRNALNNARYNTARAIYDDNKDDKEVGKKVRDTKSDVTSMPDPSSNTARINALQAKIDSGDYAPTEIKALSDSVVGKESSGIAKTLTKVRKSTVEESRKKKAQKESSSNGGPGTTNQTGGTSPSNNSPKTQSKPKEKKKKQNRNKTESHKGSECSTSNDGNKHCVAYEPKKKDESILYVNKRRADAQKEANKQARNHDSGKKKARQQAKEDKKQQKRTNKFVDKLYGN